MLRGKGTRQAKDYLKAQGFRWDSSLFAWTHYLHAEELTGILRDLFEQGYQVIPKEGMDPAYLLEGFKG